MEFIDGGQVHIFAPEEENPHIPGTDESWQESYVLYWYDMHQNVGGGFRLGREPNYKGGQSQFMIIIHSPKGTYRRVGNLPLRPNDVTATGIGNGDDSLRYNFDGKHIRWTLNDGDFAADLRVELTVPPLDVHHKAGVGEGESVLSAHVDAACHVTGSMEVKGTRYAVDAFAVRDHAWGLRDLSVLRSYRWLIADMGQGDSFVAMSFLAASDKIVRFGWVVRGGKVILAKDVVIRAIIGDDGGANYGGTLCMELSNGEMFEAAFTPIAPPISIAFTFLHPTLYHDAYSSVRWGNKTGFGIFECGNNIRAGTGMPQVYEGSIGTNGWHPKSASV